MRRLALTLALLPLLAVGCRNAPDVELLNVSYDPTRELYRKLNRLFADQYLADTGKTVRVRQSHGGSGSQARAVMDGLPADVVTLAVRPDTDAVAKRGLVASDWIERLPNRALPYYSTIVLVVRKGNPKNIRDWIDLTRDGVGVIPSNPKTGGGARLNFLAAWAAFRKSGMSEDAANEAVGRIYRNAPVLDSGARSATITFVRKMIGDVQVTWENEARLEMEELGDEVEIVYPPVSIMGEPHVAWVDANVDRRGTRATAEAYIRFLYSEAAQDVIAENFYRPTHPAVVERTRHLFPAVELLRIDEVVPGGWAAAQKRFFADGGVFDRIYKP